MVVKQMCQIEMGLTFDDMDRIAPSDPVTVAEESPPERPVPLRRRRPAPSRRGLAVIAVLLVALVTAGFWWLHDPGPAPLTRADVDRAVAKAQQQAADEQRRAPAPATVAYRTILPSLVTVTTGSGAAPNAATDASLGAGVVVNARGTILTALHVVDDGDPISIFFTDGTRAAGQIVTRNAASDIAVLQPDRLPQVVVPAVLGGGVNVGDDVYPVGNPLGLQASLSAGVVSALGRKISIGPDRVVEGLIQFDAAVNPGSSGGPLLNRGGQVVVIVTALANPSQQPYFVGIGFAVPITTAGGAAGGPQQ
jgi:S1-C subfamily serine protease